MQTIYFTTSSFIRHEGNLVDLTQYRRKLAQTQGEPEPEKAQRPAHTAHRRRSFAPGMLLDCAASIALILTALAFAIKIL